MRLARLDESIINEKLGTTIKDSNGRKLANEGATITARMIDILKGLGLTSIYIEDENIDIKLDEVIEEDKRVDIITKLRNFYKDLENDKFNEVELARFIRNDIVYNMKNEPISLPVGQVLDKINIAQHSLNVCLLCFRTATTLGLNPNEIDSLLKAALLHDAGEILRKNPKVKNNATYKGLDDLDLVYSYIKNRTNSVLVYTTIRNAEETIDGQGRLKTPEQNQNDLVKILSLANYYEHLSRQNNLLTHEAFEKIEALVNFKFEQRIYEAFRKSVYVYPTGIGVELSNGENGIVVMQNQSYPLRPIVKTSNNYYNLMENLTLFINKIAI